MDTDSAGRRDRLPMPEAERLTGFSHQQVSKWLRRLRPENVEAYKAQLRGPIYKKAMAETSLNDKANFTGENEWYTPDSI